MWVRKLRACVTLNPVSSDASDCATGIPWATPLKDGEWTDLVGVRWRMRGGPLQPRAARRLLRRPGLRVLHAYGAAPRLVEGSDRDSLIGAVDEYLADRGQPYAEFQIADFRDEDHNVMAVVQEHC